MEEYLNRKIKKIIEEFPVTGEILEEYGIGCVPCSVGTCLLKDIVKIHDLAPEQERELMARIAAVIHPDLNVEIPDVPETERSPPPGTPLERTIKYSPPLKRLVDEHRLIKRWVALIPVLTEELDVDREEDRKLISEGVEFIRRYADTYHHAKEEDVLFGYFDEELDIIEGMREDHRRARARVKKLLAALEKRDGSLIKEHLGAYADLLTEHIKKEDEILYPWMDRQLSMNQIGGIFEEFNGIAEEFRDDSAKYENFIERTEIRFRKD